ncbi:cobalt ECF transporter T component CbiQ [Methanobacterium sp. ACI-7]|uniref:cobalt ECF transporter T component CbiQ n=1 Tax=unclassified Methanobacterium TaxID=2627676 RepID=UPI0039C13740
MQTILDNYAHSNALRNVSPKFKVLFALSTLIICIISTSPVIPLLVALIVSSIIIFKAKIPAKFYFKFLAIPVAFAFITFIFMTLFFGMSEPWFNIGIFNFVIYKDGFNLGFLVFSRILGAFTCLSFLSLTNPINDIFSILKSLKIPEVVIEIAMLMYRYIFVFLEEIQNMHNSQQTRMGYCNLKNSFKSLGLLISNLFIRTWVRGEQIYITMESRCYGGSIRTFQIQKSIGIKNIMLLISFESVLLLGTYLTWGLTVI